MPEARILPEKFEFEAACGPMPLTNGRMANANSEADEDSNSAGGEFCSEDGNMDCEIRGDALIDLPCTSALRSRAGVGADNAADGYEESRLIPLWPKRELTNDVGMLFRKESAAADDDE